jgi:hypothetical protein
MEEARRVIPFELISRIDGPFNPAIPEFPKGKTPPQHRMADRASHRVLSCEVVFAWCRSVPSKLCCRLDSGLGLTS